MHDIHVVEVQPGDEGASVERVRELVAETGAASLAFMVTAVPNEQALEERLGDWVRRFGLLREGLKDVPVEVGILIQALIGHGDRNRLVGELPFQNIVGADGVQCRESFCPLDAEFQAYTHQLIRTLAEAGPDFFMIDDDFRIAGHAPAEGGCMCPLHLDRFAQQTGTPLSREELLEHLAAEGTSKIRNRWEKLREESLVEMAGVIRQAIDSVDDMIPGHFAYVLPELHFAPAIARTLAGRHQARVRISNPIYLESGHKDFPKRIAHTFHQVAQFPKETILLTEADTCPHSRYSLSVKTHLAHVSATLLAGCHGAKYWFIKTDADGWEATAPFRRMLADMRPFLDEVERIRDRVRWLGPAVPGPPGDDWGWRIFGRMGIPFTVAAGDNTGPSPQALCGTAPLTYSDGQLTSLLSGPLLLDGEAAWRICERGLGPHLGVEASPSSAPCSVELMHVIPESTRQRDVASGMTGHGRYRLVPQSKHTRTVSSFATGSAVAYRITAPGLTWYENDLGGRVAVYGVSMEAPLDWVFFNNKRKTQLLETLTWLTDGLPPAVVDTDLDVYMLHGNDKAVGGREYVCLFNLNPDTIERVRVSLPGSEVTGIDKLAINGAWEPVTFTSEGHLIHCHVDAPTMEPFILRLHRDTTEEVNYPGNLG